jgi:hypothetical protein
MSRKSLVTLAVLICMPFGIAKSDDSSKIKGLMEKIASLEKENKDLKQKIERLKKDNEELKSNKPAESNDKADAKKPSLSDLLSEDVSLKGNFQQLPPHKESGEYSLTITGRDGKKVEATGIITGSDGKPLHRTYEGAIDANKLTLKSVGSANASTLRLSLKGKGLRGTFENSQGIKADVGFVLEQ